MLGEILAMEAVLSWQQGQKKLDTAVTGLGRALGNAIVVNDGKVSSHHAEIRREGQEYLLIDLRSKNGTFVNGTQLQPALPHLLSDHDLIRLGDTTYTFTLHNVSDLDPTAYAAPPEYAPTILASPMDPVRNAGASPVPPVPGTPAYNPMPGMPMYGNGGVQPSYQAGSSVPGVPVYNSGGAQQPYQASLPLQQIPPIPVYTPPATQEPQKKGGGLKLVLGIVGGVVVLLLVACVVVTYISSRPSTQTGTAKTTGSAATPVPVGPAGTLTTYCNALKSQDYQTAYNQLDSATKSK